ncbi:MAG: DnaJ domain-containing protein [Proteobacteria bacterium]|nr:DnaJ domain-containing protein [Pseudomonadota bacterium]
MPVVARGHVRDRPFARTIYAIGAKQFTGDLIMTQGGRSYRITWERGAIIGAESPSPADSLERVALTAGLVTSTQLGDAVRIARTRPEVSHLQALVEVAHLSPQQVLTVKRRALAHRAVRVFALGEATFVLDDRPTLARDRDVAPLSPRWLIYHGLRTHYSEERLEGELASALGAAFQLAAQSRRWLGEYGLGADAKGCVAELEQRALTLDEIAAAFPRMTRKAIQVLIYALLATDALAAQPPAAPAGPRAATRPAPQTAPAHRQSGQHAAVRRARPVTSDPVPEAIPEEDGSRKFKIRTRRSTARKRAPDPRQVEQICTLMASKLKEVDAGVDHFQLLGVPRGASGQAVRNAFHELAKRLHPDRLRATGIKDDTNNSHRLFAQINLAFSVLSNKKKRAEYEAELRTGGQPGQPGQPGHQAEVEEFALRAIEAEKYFQRGEMAARRSQWGDALASFQQAVELNPDDAEHHALFAWATWRNAPDKQSVLAAVKQRFKRAIALSPRNVAAYLYRGRVAGELGDHALALDCFRKVLEFEPQHREAHTHIRLIESRMSRAGEKRKGLFDRIKGR